MPEVDYIESLARSNRSRVWADNETDIDLLGFDFLVHELVVALTEPRLLPLTVGLLGDWGSGKSSLLKITKRELEKLDDEREYVVVHFSPWQFEGYDDIKAALMSAVLDRLAEVTAGAEFAQRQQLHLLRRFPEMLRRSGRMLRRTGAAAAPLLVTTGVSMIDSDLGEMVGQPTQANAGVPAPGGDGADRPSVPATPTVTSFRGQFETLIKELEQVAAVIVLIDDLDRCLPDTVIDTFEAIRLFLNVPKSAYVIAAHQKIVESAIDFRYPKVTDSDSSGLGAQYLEKMLQLKVAIPTLAAPGAETYLQLLLAQLHLTTEQFEHVLEVVTGRRAHDMLAVHFNLGIALQILQREVMPADLYTDLGWAADIAPVLGRGLRGNPRQIKRFLNTLLLRRRSARRREIILDSAVLAKLMVLEEQHFKDFEKLFTWQIRATGPIPELLAAEAHARSDGVKAPTGDQTPADPDHEASGPDPTPAKARPNHRARNAPQTETTPTETDSLDPEVREWAQSEHVRAWLGLRPDLGPRDLRPYFTYARDKLTPGVIPARLAAHLQELLTGLQSDVEGIRNNSLRAAQKLPMQEQRIILEHLIDMMVRDPRGKATFLTMKLAQQTPEAVTTVCEALAGIPIAHVPTTMISTVILQLPIDQPDVQALLNDWQNSGDPKFTEKVTRLRARDRQSR